MSVTPSRSKPSTGAVRASDRVYETLRDEIVTWRLKPGAVLNEVDQAARLGVSRTPVREGLGRLVGDGLAVPGKGRTLIVSDVSADDVRHLFELREALETQAARLAARRADRATFERLRHRFAHASELLTGDDPQYRAYYDLVAEFDAATDEAMQSPYLLTSLEWVRAHVARARRLSQLNTARLAEAAREHALITEAIAEGDEVLAAQATAVHLRASFANILSTLRPREREPMAVEPVPADTSALEASRVDDGRPVTGPG
ncbi:GntR family transcriptional regulator [Georgenia halophila]|uniref:GntR family transcriptional regulator n=1 Tax=Georgenia halophila TaxID=620889 RepID=A0ABP8LMC8_9MICO